MIVLLDPAGDRGLCFFQTAVLRRPDFFLLQAATEPFDVDVAFRMMVGRAPVRDTEPCGTRETRGGELIIFLYGLWRWRERATTL